MQERVERAAAASRGAASAASSSSSGRLRWTQPSQASLHCRGFGAPLLDGPDASPCRGLAVPRPRRLAPPSALAAQRPRFAAPRPRRPAPAPLALALALTRACACLAAGIRGISTQKAADEQREVPIRCHLLVIPLLSRRQPTRSKLWSGRIQRLLLPR